MQKRSSDKNSVRLSVCLSVYQTRAFWQKGKRSVQIFIPYELSFSLIFWEEEWLMERPLHDSGYPVDVIYLNFQKTFDKVPHIVG